MKWALAGSLLLALPFGAAAQDGKAKAKSPSKGDHEQIIISRTADSDGKTVIEIDGDKIRVNGKEVKEGDRNEEVNVIRMKTGPRRMAMTMPGGGSWNMDFNEQGFDLFTEDSNRAMLGVSTDNADGGARIAAVNEGSAAAKAGLKAGDVITRIGDQDVDDPDDVTKAIRGRKPGDKVTVTYKREGKEAKATAELGSWKGFRINTDFVAPRVQADMDRAMEGLYEGQRGLRRLPPMAPTIYGPGRGRLGLSVQDTEDGKGVKVLEVEDESIAEKAGLREGDIITKVGSDAVTSTADASRMLRQSSEGTAYTLEVLRGNRTERIEVKFPKRLRTAEL